MTQTTLDLGLTDLPASDSDTQCTPKWIADLLPVVDLDPCSNSRSHIKAARSICLPNDGLAKPWRDLAANMWINPPYSNPLPWAQAGAEAYDAAGVEQMWLVKLDPTTRWWALLAGRGRVMLCRDRLAFEKDGFARKGSDFCTAFIWLPGGAHFTRFVAKLFQGGHVWA